MYLSRCVSTTTSTKVGSGGQDPSFMVQFMYKLKWMEEVGWMWWYSRFLSLTYLRDTDGVTEISSLFASNPLATQLIINRLLSSMGTSANNK